MSKFETSQESKAAVEELKRKNKKQRDEFAEMIKAAQLAEFKSREEQLKPYRDAREQKNEQQQKQADELWKTLERKIDEELMNPSAASYVEWKTGMMKIVACLTVLNEALFSSNLSFSDAIFYLKNIKSVASSAGLAKDKKIQRIKEFFHKTGTLPQNFDPEFSIAAKMENGRAIGQMFSGEHAEEVLFTRPNGELSPPDVFLAAFLKEKTPYELVTHPDSPLFRRVVLKNDDPDKVYDFLMKSSDALNQVRIGPENRADLDPNWKNYQVRATGFIRDPDSDEDEPRYLLVAKESYIDAATGQRHEKTINIPMSDNADDLQHGDNAQVPHYFTGTNAPREGGPNLKFHLPAAQLTTQEQLDDVLGHDFFDYCQRKVNETVTDFHVTVKMVVKENGKVDAEFYSIVNGKEYPADQHISAGVWDDLSEKFVSMVRESSLNLTFTEDEKVQYNDKYQIPKGEEIVSQLNEFLDLEVDGSVYRGCHIDWKHKTVTLTDNDGNQTKVNIKMSQTEETANRLKLSFDKEPLAGKSLEIDKPNKLMTAEELNAEFAPRLQLALEDDVKPLIKGLEQTPLRLIQHNPDGPSGPRPM